MSPLIEKMHDEQDQEDIKWCQEMISLKENDEKPKKFVWTPSKIIKRLGHEINDESR